MATARKTTKTETVTKEVTTYTLELSEYEAAEFKNDCANFGIDGTNASAIFAVRMALACPEDSEVSAPLTVSDRVLVDYGDYLWTKGIERA